MVLHVKANCASPEIAGTMPFPCTLAPHLPLTVLQIFGPLHGN